MSCGYDHALALRDDGEIVAWGKNRYWQLEVPRLPSGRRCVGISAGLNFSLALLDNGQAIAWGNLRYNGEGEAIPEFPEGRTCVQVSASPVSEYVHLFVVPKNEG